MAKYLKIKSSAGASIAEWNDGLQCVAEELEDCGVGDEIVLSIIEMTEEEFEALGEFED